MSEGFPDKSKASVPMTTPTSRPIDIKSGDIVGEGLLHLRGFDTGERRIRAAKIWGWMWLCALISLPVCGLHLVSIPAFLVAGPIMAFIRYRITEVPDHVSGSCPSCKSEFARPLAKGARLPKRVYCPACNATLYLLEKEEHAFPG